MISNNKSHFVLSFLDNGSISKIRSGKIIYIWYMFLNIQHKKKTHHDWQKSSRARLNLAWAENEPACSGSVRIRPSLRLARLGQVTSCANTTWPVDLDSEPQRTSANSFWFGLSFLSPSPVLPHSAPVSHGPTSTAVVSASHSPPPHHSPDSQLTRSWPSPIPRS